MFVIKPELAEAYKAGKTTPTTPPVPGDPKRPDLKPPPGDPPVPPSKDSSKRIKTLAWTSDVPPQKWMNFYTKVLSKFVGQGGLRLVLHEVVEPPTGISTQMIEDAKVALRELGLSDEMQSKA